MLNDDVYCTCTTWTIGTKRTAKANAKQSATERVERQKVNEPQLHVQMLMIWPSSRFSTELKWRLLYMWKINFLHFMIYIGGGSGTGTTTTTGSGNQFQINCASGARAFAHSVQCKNLFKCWKRHLSISLSLSFFFSPTYRQKWIHSESHFHRRWAFYVIQKPFGLLCMRVSSSVCDSFLFSAHSFVLVL